jgi:hypothetical protein
LIAHGPRDADAADIGQGLEPGCDVNAVAQHVIALDDHVAKIDADSEADAPILRDGDLMSGRGELDLDRAPDRLDRAAELDQQAVAHSLDEPPAMPGSGRVD